jgi:hypothetical protein
MYRYYRYYGGTGSHEHPTVGETITEIQDEIGVLEAEFDEKKWLLTLESEFMQYMMDGGKYPHPFQIYEPEMDDADMLPNMVKLHELSIRHFGEVPFYKEIPRISNTYIKPGTNEWYCRWVSDYKSIPEASISNIIKLEGLPELMTSLGSLYERLLKYKLMLRKINFARGLRDSDVLIDDVIIQVSLSFDGKTEFDFMTHAESVYWNDKLLSVGFGRV